MLAEVLLAPQALKRLLEPAEVADAVAFLLADTGTCVHGRAARHGRRLDGALNTGVRHRSLSTLWSDRHDRDTNDTARRFGDHVTRVGLGMHRHTIGTVSA